MREHVDHRILAALRFVDATLGRPLAARLEVVGAGVRVIRNRSGLYVLGEAPVAMPLHRRDAVAVAP